MREWDTEVAVIGAGIMGASAAWRLALQGYRVDVLEQFDLGHVRGSSHGASRIFRFAYDDVDYVRLAQAALPLWRQAESASGAALLRTTGGLDLGPAENLAPIASALSAAGVSYRRLSYDELHRSYPAYAVPEGWEAIYQQDTGILDADTCRSTLLELARQTGARITSQTRARAICPAGDDVVVEIDGGRLRARRVVIAAAGWSNRLLEPLHLTVPITVTRELVCYFPYRSPPNLLPFIWHASGSVPEFYGLPNGNRNEVKVGEHGTGPEVDPDSEPQIDHERARRVQDFVRANLPGLADSSPTCETCLYASTPDDDFVVDRSGPIILGFGFGGHGFKFGAIIGEMLAQLVQGASPHVSPRFSRSRFAPRGSGTIV